MQEMQTTVTDNRGVCQSVRQSACHAAQLGFSMQKRLNGSHPVRGEHSWETKEHCVRRVQPGGLGGWNKSAHCGPTTTYLKNGWS